jgi:hypothetical protein
VPEAAVPEAAVAEAAVPEAAVPEAAVPVPEAAVPEAAVPEAAVPCARGAVDNVIAAVSGAAAKAKTSGAFQKFLVGNWKLPDIDGGK